MPVYSHSRLSSYEQCPLQYRFRYLDRVPAEVESIEAFTGKLVHRVLEMVFQASGPFRVSSLEEALCRFEELWSGEWSDRVRVAKTGYGPGDYRELGRRCLRNFFLMETPSEGGRTLAIEEKVTVKLDGEGRYRMQGFIDRLALAEDGSYEIHDYKTGGRLPSQSVLDGDRQLAVYQLGLEERLGERIPIRLVWHYLAFRKTLFSSRTRSQLDALRGELIGAIRRVEQAGEFPARVGPLCRWCPYEEICPDRRAERTGRNRETRARVEEGIRLVDGYVALLRGGESAPERDPDLLERHRRALLAHSRREGLETVIGNTHVARIRKRPRLQLPPKGTERREALEVLLREEGLWDGVSDMDPDRLLREIRRREGSPRLRDAISSYGIIEESCDIQLVPLGGGQLAFFE